MLFLNALSVEGILLEECYCVSKNNHISHHMTHSVISSVMRLYQISCPSCCRWWALSAVNPVRALKDPRDTPELQGPKAPAGLLAIPADTALRATQGLRASKDPQGSKVTETPGSNASKLCKWLWLCILIV